MTGFQHSMLERRRSSVWTDVPSSRISKEVAQSAARRSRNRTKHVNRKRMSPSFILPRIFAGEERGGGPFCRRNLRNPRKLASIVVPRLRILSDFLVSALCLNCFSRDLRVLRGGRFSPQESQKSLRKLKRDSFCAALSLPPSLGLRDRWASPKTRRRLL